MTLGLQDSGSETVEITKGLAVGDTVLTGGSLGLEPGTVVRVQAARDQPQQIERTN